MEKEEKGGFLGTLTGCTGTKKFFKEVEYHAP